MSNLANSPNPSPRPDSGPDEEYFAEEPGLDPKPARGPIGKRIKGYKILEEIGRGAMGLVFKAHQYSMDRIVALKILPGSLARKERFRKRFMREAQAAGRLSHPNLVAVHDFGEFNGVYFIVMEYIQGISAMKRLKKQGPFEEAELIRLAREISSALAVAHEQGIIHRDVKPDNILIDKDGRFRLADMGLACAVNEEVLGQEEAGGEARAGEGHGSGNLTLAGTTLGTPNYMAPEQVRGEAVDGRSDLYSLGATLYTLACGSPLFEGRNSRELLKKAVQERPQSIAKRAPKLSKGFAQLIDRLVLKAPDERFASAEELLKALTLLEKPGVREATAEQPLEAAAAESRRRPGRTRRTLRMRARVGSGGSGLWVGVGLLALCLAGLAGLAFYREGRMLPPWLRSGTGSPGSPEGGGDPLAGLDAHQREGWSAMTTEWEGLARSDPGLAAQAVERYLKGHPEEGPRAEAQRLRERYLQEAQRRVGLFDAAHRQAQILLLKREYGKTKEVLAGYLKENGEHLEAQRIRRFLETVERQIAECVQARGQSFAQHLEKKELALAQQTLEVLAFEAGPQHPEVLRLRQQLDAVRPRPAAKKGEPAAKKEEKAKPGPKEPPSPDQKSKAVEKREPSPIFP